MATIVIAVDDPILRAQLEVTLVERGHEVVVAHTGTEAEDLSLRAAPQLVVLDMDMPGVPAAQVARRLRTEPGTADTVILVVADAREPQLPPGFGAADTEMIIKPTSGPAVAIRIEALLARGVGDAAAPPSPAQGRLIAVAGPKGGCGRTTIAVNVALAIAAARRDAVETYPNGGTLLLDGHLAQGDLDVHLDLRSNRSVRDLALHADHLDSSSFEEALVTHRDGLRVLIGARGYGDSALIAPALWRNVLHIALDVSETIVVDLGPGYEDERALATLAAASVVLVVVTPEIGSVRNARQLLDLAPRLGLDRSRLRPVLNRSQDRANLNARAVATALGVEQASLIVLPDGGPSIVGHINRSMPIIEDRRSKLGRELERLAHALLPTRP